VTDGFRCVAVETATERCSVAAANGSEQAVIELSSARDSSREVYDAILSALERVSLSLSQLDCIAFGCGPGSFTGLRVAAGVAQGLAYAKSLPVCKISSLAALALTAGQKHSQTRIAACLDARMGEAYLGLYEYRQAGGVQSVQADQLLAPDNIQLESVSDGWLAAGPGWDVWPEVIERHANVVVLQETAVWPNAAAVLQLAQHEFAQGNTVAAAAAIPNYIREQVTG